MDEKIMLSHGSGGEKSSELISGLFYKYFDNPIIREQTDSALCGISSKNIAFTTDGYVVNPIFFPGGDIGKLSVCGTVNDLSVSFAKPLYLSASFIIEEGFLYSDLEKIVISMKEEADKAGVKIVTGDTKVVDKGACDKIFITTSGIGAVEDKYLDVASGKNIKAGDKILINGSIADHGMTVMALRNSINAKADIRSDCASLNELSDIIKEMKIVPSFCRDATRGGLATVLAEISKKINCGIDLFEESVSVNEAVRGLTEMLGFDPLYVANEGKMVLIVRENDAEKILGAWKKHPLGKNSSCIGEVVSDHKGRTILKTVSGGSRVLDLLSGMQLPRIC